MIAALDSAISLTSLSVFYTPDNFMTYQKLDSNIDNTSGFIYFRDVQTGWLSGSYDPLNNIHKFSGTLTGMNVISDQSA